jgi:hypothetical protein
MVILEEVDMRLKHSGRNTILQPFDAAFETRSRTTARLCAFEEVEHSWLIAILTVAEVAIGFIEGGH